MTPGIRPLVAGNWKMNGLQAALSEVEAIGQGFAGDVAERAEAALCFPATLLARAAAVLADSPVKAGGQDCHAKPSGAHTGDISAEMLKDAGAAYVIVGHSERRTDHEESNADVLAKAQAAWRGGLVAILCIGETGDERKAGETLDVLSTQLKASIPQGATAENTVIAYEPVWAIGTGLTPTVQDVADAHAHIRRELGAIVGDGASAMRILYGGSVKPVNAVELMGVVNVDGALIGGASMKAADFLGIAEAYRQL